MRVRLLRHPTRDVDFISLLETFLVAAVTTVLVIRTQLWATNYPQLGGHGLHIAHLLYGGIFMVIAIGLLLVYLNRGVRRPSAIIGGVGFGFFIDELGKFITSDNNYFFQPAAALIYLIFVGIYLIIRALDKRRGLTQMEYVVNALDLVSEAARNDLDQREKDRALRLLDQADPNDPLVAPVRDLLTKLDAIPSREPAWPARQAKRIRDGYLAFSQRRIFTPLVIGVIVVWGVLSLFFTFELVLSIGLHLGGAAPGSVNDDIDSLSTINWLSLGSSTLSGILVVIGVVALRQGRRVAAFVWFERALLVSIFLTRSFAFVESQFGAVFGLAVDLLLLVSVHLMQRSERVRDAELEPAPVVPTPAPAAQGVDPVVGADEDRSIPGLR
jgi:hypothetical protein